jgi:hypothetical protein
MTKLLPTKYWRAMATYGQGFQDDGLASIKGKKLRLARPELAEGRKTALLHEQGRALDFSVGT